MDQNNVSVGGWGAPIPEPTNSRHGSQQTSENGSEYSDDDFDYDSEEEDDDEEYAPLQMGAWGAQPTGAQADVNAIQMPDWNQRPRDETPSLTFTSADWGKLCDPKVVIKSGIGSGNLHRKGANYKPVDEQLILNQRLKLGSPLPGKKKKRSGKPGKKPKPAGNPPPPRRPPPPSSTLRPPSSSSRRPPLAQSAWGNSQLSSTPFWEAGGAKASKYATTPTPPPAAAPAPAPVTPAPVPVTPAPAPAQQRLPGGRAAPTGGATSKWATQPLMENPPAPQSQPRPVPAPQPQSQPQPPQQRPKPTGAAASKYAPAQPQPPPMAQPAPVAPSPPPAPTTVHGTISLNDLAAVKPPRETIFQLNIELIPGVSAILPVYETDDYVALVKEFGAKHHLTISPQAEASFAEKIKLMVAALRKQQAEAQQQ